MPTSFHTELSSAKKAAIFGILGALALVLGLLDNVISAEAAFLPMGSRLGLSNIVVVLAASISPAGAYYVFALKVGFAFVTRGATAALMSFSGGILAVSATVALIVLRKRKSFFERNLSCIGIAVTSAALHNIGQLICACLLTGTAQLIGYGKYLILFALASGTATGVALNLLVPRVEKAIYKNQTGN